MSERVARDPGLQQERTTLAWRRTGLALLVASLAIGRLTLESLGPVVVLPTVVAAAVAAWVVAESVRARRMSRRHPHEPDFSVLAGGRLPALVAVVVGVLALAEVSAALVRLL